MRRSMIAAALVLLGCVRAPGGSTPSEPGAPAPPTSEPVVAATPGPEPSPAPSLVLVDEDWVWNDGDPQGPLLRIVELESTKDGDPEAAQALLRALESLMICYELELARRPELQLTLGIHRTAPTDADPRGLEITEDVREPTGAPACAAKALAAVLPPHARDPRGRYGLRFYPHRDTAYALRWPDVGEAMIEHPAGPCFVVHTHPCPPRKHCMAPTRERTRCPHPADRPGVAVRWALGEASADGQRPRTGVELVGADGGLVWRTDLEPEDAARLGPLPADEAQRHVADFRREPLPGALLLALEPTRIVLADRAGVRVYDRHTGERGFRIGPLEPEAPRMFLDEGTFTARKGELRCRGDAGRGAFATRCGDAFLWFDGHELAVMGHGPPMHMPSQTTLADRTSTRTGGAARPKVSLRTNGWRVVVEGRVFLQ